MVPQFGFSVQQLGAAHVMVQYGAQQALRLTDTGAKYLPVQIFTLVSNRQPLPQSAIFNQIQTWKSGQTRHTGLINQSVIHYRTLNYRTFNEIIWTINSDKLIIFSITILANFDLAPNYNYLNFLNLNILFKKCVWLENSIFLARFLKNNSISVCFIYLFINVFQLGAIKKTTIN